MSDTLAPGESARVLVPTENDVLGTRKEVIQTSIEPALSLGMTGACHHRITPCACAREKCEHPRPLYFCTVEFAAFSHDLRIFAQLNLQLSNIPLRLHT